MQELTTTITLAGQRFVILPEAEYLRLHQTGEGAAGPQLPLPDKRGNYPAIEAARAVLGQKLIEKRRALGWSQAELARRAGVRTETVNRLEQGKHTPSLPTVDKLQRALDATANKTARAKRKQ
ncbi:MAG: helix-turn-helix transcriptional regulator [Pirellulales bacterium]